MNKNNWHGTDENEGGQPRMLVRMWKRNPHPLLVGMQNGTATFERQFGSFLQSKHNFTIHPSNCAPWYLPKGAEYLTFTQNPHTILQQLYS